MTQSFDEALRCFSPALPLAVGLSGGADSTALLLACAARWPGQVQAIHVHHGLQAAADGFERHCTCRCRYSVSMRAMPLGKARKRPRAMRVTGLLRLQPRTGKRQQLFNP